MTGPRQENWDFRADAYIDWLCTPMKDRQPRTQKEFAASLNLDPGQLIRFRKDPEFLRKWEVRYRQTVGSLERQQEVLNALHRAATDLDDPRMVSAAKAYLEAVDAIKPRKLDVTVTPGKAASQLSDDELYDLLAVRAAKELEQRNAIEVDMRSVTIHDADDEVDRDAGQ